jgi:hypothetical protein
MTGAWGSRPHGIRAVVVRQGSECRQFVNQHPLSVQDALTQLGVNGTTRAATHQVYGPLAALPLDYVTVQGLGSQTVKIADRVNSLDPALLIGGLAKASALASLNPKGSLRLSPHRATHNPKPRPISHASPFRVWLSHS